MRKPFAVALSLVALLLPSTAAGAAISPPTAQQSLTVYIPPATTPQSQPMTDAEWPPIPVRLNQKMATRSGPGTLYTEELGTLPKSTEITVFWQEITGVPWVIVEFSRNGSLYRAYTGMKRIDTDSDVPVLSAGQRKAVLGPDIRPCYGPGFMYASVTHTLRGGTIVEICCQEQGYALIDYPHPTEPDKRFRAWVPASALKSLP